ncbi:MAG: orotidine-5'-phosphate decarboxylase [Promethearchaeota archaeon]
MTRTPNFRSRLEEKTRQKRSIVCVGLDPDLEAPQFPAFLREGGHPKLEFAKQLIDAVADLVPVLKPNTRFYEPSEWNELRDIVKYAHKHDLEVIGDCKENDIGSTMGRAYSRQFGTFGFDAITVNGYLGSDGVIGTAGEPIFRPWFQRGKGLFVLVKTSNSSSSQVQDLQVMGPAGERPLYATVAELVEQWSSEYEHVIGGVVGATHPRELTDLRELLSGFILIPGFGAQGATAADIGSALSSGKPCIVNSSRGIMYAHARRFKGKFNEEEFAQASREEVLIMRDELGKYLQW